MGADSLLSPKRGSSDESKDKLFTMSAAFVIARYGLLQSLAQDVLSELGVSAPLAPSWWQASPQMIRVAKAFIAGNIRLLMGRNELSFETVFPKENEVRAEDRRDS